MPSERIDTFEPVPISNESGDVRTPVSVWVLNPYRYMVTVGDRQTKFFSDKTVPEEIKALIAMVRAFPEDVRMNRSFGPGIYVPPDPRLACIGWQLIPRGPDWEAYILVLSQKLFERIRW